MNCANCNTGITRKLKSRELSYKMLFCSKACHQEYRRNNRNTFTCANCGITVKRTKASKPVKNSFCSLSCSATFNNTHKTKGNRRSKLEAYLEEQLRHDFPNLEIVCNSKELIGSELDFYFPQLKLAIELNGIFHYEPIYGEEKLQRIQGNDSQKSIKCFEAGVEFCTIDASSVVYLSHTAKDKFYGIVKSVIVPNLGRVGDI